MAIYKVEVDLGLEYDLGQVLEDSVQVNDDDVVEVNEAVTVQFNRARGEFTARTVVTVEAEDEDAAISIAQDAVSQSYEVEEFVSVQYVNGEVLEVTRDFVIFESSTSALYTSNDGNLDLQTDTSGDNKVFFFEVDGEVVFSTRSRCMVDAYIAGYDLAHAKYRTTG